VIGRDPLQNRSAARKIKNVLGGAHKKTRILPNGLEVIRKVMTISPVGFNPAENQEKTCNTDQECDTIRSSFS
jgi:hypothetical protein